MSYQCLDDALDLIVKFGRGCRIAKADIEEAYRIVPIHPESCHLLGFTWGGKLFYDRSLPFGLSYSCRLFERFATALHWILTNKFNVKALTHILDDFMYFGPSDDDSCRVGLSCFILMCSKLNIP